MPAGGMLAVSEASDSINRALVLVTSDPPGGRPLQCGNLQTHRLRPSSVVCTLFLLVYTERKIIKAGDCVFG